VPSRVAGPRSRLRQRNAILNNHGDHLHHFGSITSFQDTDELKTIIDFLVERIQRVVHCVQSLVRLLVLSDPLQCALEPIVGPLIQRLVEDVVERDVLHAFRQRQLALIVARPDGRQLHTSMVSRCYTDQIHSY
jgi:hypothetical protein